MKHVLIPASLAAACVSGASASADTVAQQVAACAAQTRASGSYEIIRDAPVPVVDAGSGATGGGAWNVNDCLQDMYQVQYARLASGQIAVVAAGTGRVRDTGYDRQCTAVLQGGSRYCIRR